MKITEHDLLRLKYAFAIHLTWKIIEADEKILAEEVRYFNECFPPELLKSLDLVDAAERKRLYEIAVEELPKLLNFGERLELLGMFLGASVSDGEMEFREFGVLEAAATALEIPQADFLEYFDKVFGQT